MQMCPNIAFRSATLDHASEEELHQLADRMGVRTIIDLRSELEADMAKAGKPFSTFPVAAAMKLKPRDIVTQDPDSGSVKEKFEDNNRRTVMINFAGQNFRKNAVWKPAPIKTKIKVAGNYIAGRKHKAAKIVGEEVLSKKGLIGLYRDFIDYCQHELNQALQVLADPTAYPILVHCTQGKDRTGLVTALALASVGVSFDDIVADYSKSQEGLAPIHDQMVEEMAKDGLDPSFADAPPEVMMEALQYIEIQYGSIARYLDIIGFDENCRFRLQQLLKRPPIQEHNELVEDVLTEVVNKPVMQDAHVTEVMTPAALADFSGPRVQVAPTPVSTSADVSTTTPATLQQPAVVTTEPTLMGATIEQPLQQDKLQQQEGVEVVTGTPAL